MLKLQTRVMQVTLVIFLLMITTSCSDKAMSVLFDVPPPKEITEPTVEVSEALSQAPATTDNLSPVFTFAQDPNAERPPIEDVLDWQKAQEMLPKDYKGKVDWSAALRQGIVRPRSGEDPRSQYATIFKYDFIMRAEKPKNEAYFPHSAHTEWLGCKNCHINLYPYKRNPATMKEMKKGESCGNCHGKKNVAFSLRQCKRCHLNR